MPLALASLVRALIPSLVSLAPRVVEAVRSSFQSPQGLKAQINTGMPEVKAEEPKAFLGAKPVSVSEGRSGGTTVSSQVLTASSTGQNTETPVSREKGTVGTTRETQSVSAPLNERIPPPASPQRLVGTTQTGTSVGAPTPPAPVGLQGRIGVSVPVLGGGGGGIPSPAMPSTIVQREAVAEPISQVIQKILAQRQVPEEQQRLVETPLPEAIEERARALRPKTLEEVLNEILSRR
jgi:hypothetical protein